MPKPDLALVPEFYHKYVNSVQENELQQAFDSHSKALLNVLEQIPAEKWNHRYAPGKWSIKEMVQHIIDTERIFCYRALCFARKESTSLPGFDEVAYAEHSRAEGRTAGSLIEELKVVQQSSIQLYLSFDEEQLGTSGVANGSTVSVHAIGFILVGHVLHHLAILHERYLPGITTANS